VIVDLILTMLIGDYKSIRIMHELCRKSKEKEMAVFMEWEWNAR